MEYRRLGRTELRVSAVGFGTNELRLVPERQAIETLVRGFELGVNIVHTSPDYEGAEDLVARAVAETDRQVIVASQGYDVHGNAHGPADHFERLFEATCERLRTERLDLYGIAAVDDREAYGENVWGPGGMIEILQRKKQEGRLGGIYCTTHGDPAHVRRLVESGAFDAIMVSYNPLGFHLLTLHPPPGRHFESPARNGLEIFPLCRERDIGVMVMMPLAGGLLTPSRAFPSRHGASPPAPTLAATDILRTILQDQDIACVLPGTASIEEAEENARAGHAPLTVPPSTLSLLTDRVASVQTSLCSRCGACDTLCSQHLPVSWLMRAHAMSTQPAESFETWAEVEYFTLHPSLAATCLTCPEVTCACPYGIELPRRLPEVHQEMVDLMQQGLVAPPSVLQQTRGDESFGARLLTRDLPTELRLGERRTCRVHLENAGTRGWLRHRDDLQAGVLLAVLLDGVRVAEAAPRDDVHPGGRGHVVFELDAPSKPGPARLRLLLLGQHHAYAEAAGILIYEGELTVEEPPTPRPLLPTVGEGETFQAAPPRTGRGGRGAVGIKGPHGGMERASLRRFARWLRRLLMAPASAPPEVPPLPAPDPPVAEPPPPRPYDVGWTGHNLPATWMEEEPYHVYLDVENRGSRPWRAAPEDGNSVNLVVRRNGELIAMHPLSHDVGPGERALLSFPLTFPKGLGDWALSFSFVEQNIAWFDQQGARPLNVRVGRAPAEETPASRARTIARRANSSFYAASQGVPRSRDGRAYPLVIQEANGARIRDPDGHEWIDYVMGWGSALPGYGHPEIVRAVADALGGGAILSLPHTLEMEVTQTLCEVIPCAEVALFGKNGSDACTAAVRAARAHTGRGTILFSGYHGWQEPFASVFEPALARPGQQPLVHPFRLNDLEGFCHLVKAHAGDIAAIMLEPAAQVEGVDGPVRDCDPAFLRQVAEICREQGAVLIFDEIMTGFRYAQGSVQQATGVIPDLAVFGKALAGGFPLSVLVGRRHILEPALPGLFYHPTFKGDVPAFAAAAAALRLYRSLDAARQVQQTGGRLKRGIDEVSASLGIAGRMVGLPYRMVYRFDEPDERRRTLMRTLLQQELLKHGVLTFRGFMLPSLAHGDEEIAQTLDAFRAALTVVERAAHSDDFASSLEIPLIT